MPGITRSQTKGENVSDDETYNGWKNHATWCVNLHLSNDEPLYREALVRTREAVTRADDNEGEHPYWTREEGRRYSVADMLKTWCEEMIEAYQARWSNIGLGSDEPRLMIWDLVTRYLGDVDWDEIADAWIESVSEEVTPS